MSSQRDDGWYYVHPGSQRGPKPVALTGEAWRAQVERDALDCGHTPEFAAWLAKEVATPKTHDQISAMSPRMRTALGLRMSADRPVDELADLAAAVGCPALLPQLRAAALPLAEVRALVRDAIDLKTMTITGSRADALRANLQARTYWSHQR